MARPIANPITTPTTSAATTQTATDRIDTEKKNGIPHAYPRRSRPTHAAMSERWVLAFVGG